MGSFQGLIAELDELAIARTVGVKHDKARMNYSPRINTVDNFQEFTEVIADYYNYHMSACVVHGGFLSRSESAGRAKEILEKEYRRKGGNINSAFNDAHYGTDGGLRVILDKIAEQLKTESIERHIRDAFDRYVDPTSWDQKVDIIRQFLSHFGHLLSPAIRADQPERYAQNYEELIREYVEALKRSYSGFRKF